MKTSLKSGGRIAATLFLVIHGPALGRAQTSEMRLGSLARRNLAGSTAPHATSPSISTALQRYVFGRADLAAGNAPQAVALGAFQTGGPLSIAVGDLGSNSVSILLGNPDGTFQPAATYATAQAGLGDIVTADFNGDHNLDLAVAFGNNTVAIFLGNGDGTFQPPASYPTIAGSYALAVADFNRDGHQDLALVNQITYTVSILLGNGDGTFKPTVTYATGNIPTSVAVGDFNGDGIPDLATANEEGPTISILLGNGNGTFKPQVEYATGNFPYFLVVSDFNGDHKLARQQRSCGNLL
jgi:hypothetical protein